MQTASITEAKNNLSKLLKKVRHGQSILILDRNVPVARLEPLASGSPESDEARLLELGSSVVQVLLDEREEAR